MVCGSSYPSDCDCPCIIEGNLKSLRADLGKKIEALIEAYRPFVVGETRRIAMATSQSLHSGRKEVELGDADQSRLKSNPEAKKALIKMFQEVALDLWNYGSYLDLNDERACLWEGVEFEAGIFTHFPKCRWERWENYAEEIETYYIEV
jgi:hypothetical protein